MLSFVLEFNVASGSVVRVCFCNSIYVFSLAFFKDGGCTLELKLTNKKRGSVETNDHGLLQLQQPEQSSAHVRVPAH